MSTISGNLALLQRTKAGQRALLEEMYPDMDFSTVPFREYGRLFTGRKYVPGFVGGWKAYGRSNSEDPATREILPDYSGNGRDIRLYNFGFAGMSGYGGYAQENYSFVANLSDIYSVQSVGAKVVVNKKTSSSIPALSKVLNKNISAGWNLGVVNKIKAGDYGVVIWKTKSGGAEAEILCELAPGDTGTFVNEQTDIEAGVIYIMAGPQIAVPAGQSFSFEFLPDYPGALVSDGVDDYGQCIKGFALPDDYTVVAIRKILNEKEIDSSFASKSSGVNKGAFLLENGNSNTYSYGQVTSNLNPFPPLFIYQTKTSYCGKTITPGTITDTEDDILCLFRKRVNESSAYYKCALYDLRIYDHSLTAEELAAVKDEMMSDYENATGGGINDITYVADWDGKGRSNDEEEEPMRSQWVDKKTGKVINLSNFSFSEMSGWNGYATDFIEKPWSVVNSAAFQADLVTVEPLRLKFKGILTDGHISCGIVISNANIPDKAITYRLRVKGIKSNQLVRLRNESVSPIAETLLREDGVIEMDISKGSVSGSLYIYMYTSGAANPDVDITVEQLPLYPGALVFDGVDDRIQAEEALGEVGTVLIHWKNIGLPVGHYLYNTGWEEDAGRLYCWNTEGNIACGIPHMQMDGHPIMVYHRSPTISSGLLSSSAGENNCPIFRLIFIKEQLDDTQQEFLKWKVEKEYRDWCKANGYEYAINQLTE